jgi:hypothetical protein
MPGLDTTVLFQRITLDIIVIVIAVAVSALCLYLFARATLTTKDSKLAERLRRDGRE